MINFVKINSLLNKNNEYVEADHCGILIIDEDKKDATIQSINNYKDCLICTTNKGEFKIGEILMQIMIGICANNNVEKIGLTDNSYLECANEKIPLIYLRTLTKGMPYYSKFGFPPLIIMLMI